MTQLIEIQDDDYVISDTGTLGSEYIVMPLNEVFQNLDDALAAIKADMEREQFWPSVFYVNDHGNIDLVDVNNGNALASWV